MTGPRPVHPVTNLGPFTMRADDGPYDETWCHAGAMLAAGLHPIAAWNVMSQAALTLIGDWPEGGAGSGSGPDGGDGS